MSWIEAVRQIGLYVQVIGEAQTEASLSCRLRHKSYHQLYGKLALTNACVPVIVYVCLYTERCD